MTSTLTHSPTKLLRGLNIRKSLSLYESLSRTSQNQPCTPVLTPLMNITSTVHPHPLLDPLHPLDEPLGPHTSIDDSHHPKQEVKTPEMKEIFIEKEKNKSSSTFHHHKLLDPLQLLCEPLGPHPDPSRHPDREEALPETRSYELDRIKKKSSSIEIPNQTQEASRRTARWGSCPRGSTELSPATTPPRPGGAQQNSVELNPTNQPPQNFAGGAQLSSNSGKPTNQLQDNQVRAGGAQLNSVKPTPKTKPPHHPPPWNIGETSINPNSENPTTSPHNNPNQNQKPTPTPAQGARPKTKTNLHQPTTVNFKPETNTNHKTTPNKPTQTKKPNHRKGVPDCDKTTRKPTTLPDMWRKKKTNEIKDNKEPEPKPDSKNQKPDEDQNQDEKETPVTIEPKIVTLKPPKKTDTPKTKKPKPKTMNQNQPSTQISSMKKFFETVFKPGGQESETKPKNQTSKNPTLKTKPENQTNENLKNETKTHENAATNINARKPTFNPPNPVKIVVQPARDDKPPEFPSTPRTSHTSHPPSTSDASHHTSSRNLSPNTTQQNLSTLSQCALNLGIVPTNNSRDNMYTKHKPRGEHDWPKISSGGRNNQS